jgi:16S rRNA (cytidine1402-2'-O)-methyltransferase
MVATPIGNLDDMTFRGVSVLRSVHTVACEDTRRTGKLLAHFEIRKPLLSLHSHSDARRSDQIVAILADGHDVAYATDAGTPSVSDPGVALTRTIRAAGFPVVPIPGVSAFATLLSVSGFGGRTVTFEGFLSPKRGRRRNRLQELLQRGEAFLLYESPHRILKLLEDLAEIEGERPVLIGREMTKMHEEFLHGTAKRVLEDLGSRQRVRGELSVLVSGRKNE